MSITLQGQVKGLNPITRPLSLRLKIAVDVQPAVQVQPVQPAQQQHNTESRKCNTQFNFVQLLCYNIYKSITDVLN